MFREYYSKDSVDFLEGSPQQVRYRSKMYMTFEPDMTVGSLDDKITTLDFVAVVSLVLHKIVWDCQIAFLSQHNMFVINFLMAKL